MRNIRENEGSKYIMYSAHDTQIAIMWEFLEKYLEFDDWYYIQYGS
jgi:hypothetical protein